jgi:glycosyltransferase involved in cell wall biosynthesis
MAGRLRPWKGQRAFLQMARLVKAEFPGVAFVVIGGAPFGGDSDYEQELRSAAAAADLAGTVYFTGHLADVRPALAALDIFVHPGEPEPFGLVNIEVMAMGKPVVAFAHGALPEIVLSAQTGLLTPPGDIPLLAAAVGQLINDPVRRAQMGAAGRRRVQERFTIQQTAAGVSAILHAIMEPPP